MAGKRWKYSRFDVTLEYKTESRKVEARLALCVLDRKGKILLEKTSWSTKKNAKKACVGLKLDGVVGRVKYTIEERHCAPGLPSRIVDTFKI